MVKMATSIAKEARLNCTKFRTGFKHNIDQYHEMHSFVLGRQWNEEEEDMLQTFKKVPLQANKLATLANVLSGEQQQNTGQLEVVPVSECGEQVIEIRSVITKQVLMSSDAETAQQKAFDQANIGGYGALFWDTYYRSRSSWDLDIGLRASNDATRFFWDLGAETESKIDGMFAGYYYRMTRTRFRSLYGKDLEQKILKSSSVTADKAEIALAVQPGQQADEFSWADDDSITLLHYYKRKLVPDTLYKMSNGKSLNQDEMGELIRKSQLHSQKIQEQMDMLGDLGGYMPQGEESEINGERIMLYDMGEPVRIEDRRSEKRSQIIHYHIAGDYLLEKSEFPADDLPIIFVDQKSFWQKDGKQVCRPFFIDCIDTQRYINYIRTQSAFILKVSRYDQFLVSKKNVQGMDTQRIWKDPFNIQGALIYDESPSGAKPEQLQPPELSRSLVEQYQIALDDLYSSTGLYPARMGQESNEVSGAAIRERTQQGNNATYGAFKSVSRAMAACGTVLNQMIPRVYDSERVIHLMNPHQGQRFITINKQQDAYGELIENDIREGTFEVVLKPGPSYQGQKSQALDSLNAIIQADPQLFSLIADLYAENLPLSNTTEIKNRLKTLVPPQIIEAGKTGKMPPPQPPQPDPVAQQELKIKEGQLQLKQQEIQNKAQEQQANYQLEMQKLEKEYASLQAEMTDMKMRAESENYKTQAQLHLGHSDNLAKILTHNPGFQREQKQQARQ